MQASLPRTSYRSAAILALCTSFTPLMFLAPASASAQRGPAAPVATMTARIACKVEKEILPFSRSYRGRVAPDGILFKLGKNKEELLPYSDIKEAAFSPGAFISADVVLVRKSKKGIREFDLVFPPTPEFNTKAQNLKNAIESMMAYDAQGKPVICSDDAKDYAEELADFTQKTVDWRALPTKPEVSEDVYKARLLAEDAIKHQDLNGAAKYYENGVAAQPTWDQGWFNLALVYEQLADYFDAAQCMKHYVILMPDAPDYKAARDNIILWEAKAEAAGSPSTSTIPRPASLAGSIPGSTNAK